MTSMFTTVRLVLIILLNEGYARNTQDTEVILLPSWQNSKNASEIPLTFQVFGQLIQLNLYRNDKMISSEFQVWKHNADGIMEELSELSAPTLCYYLHRDDIGSAAINFCQEGKLHGLIFLENATLEITPLRNSFTMSPLLDDRYVKEEFNPFGELHVVKRSPKPKYPLKQSKFGPKRYRKWIMFNEKKSFDERQLIKTRKEILTLELAVFFDEIAYRLFSPFLDEDDEKIRDMLLAYVNSIQALYHHPSLGVSIDISLVRLDIIQKQPLDLPHFDGERGSLLDSFCNYAKARNPSEDTDPRHWDMGLYVTGLDLYAFEDGRKNGATMGLATVGGLCIAQYSCVIAELGVTDQFGKPYPSAGFTSVYIAAHEIGHNLGMHHDSSGNTCPKDGYIMSPSRGTRGETVWSDCSREIAEALSWKKICLLDKPTPFGNASDIEHSRYRELPGREWTAKKQCELLLRDKDATVVTLYQACQSLQCKTPHRSGYYFAGPALDGTYCATDRECRGGECVPILKLPDIPSVQSGSWTAWKEGSCNSGCLQKSKGARIRQRFCENRNREWRAVDCKGPYYDVLLCKDETLCKKKRRTIGEFAALKCSVFSEKLPELDSTNKGGLQAAHESNRPWMACAIFCRRKDIAAYYAPRVELNDLGLDPYFPDGTWCHTEEGQDYFCRQHHCLPETFRFGKKFDTKDHRNDEDELGPQNAQSRFGIIDRLIKYLTLSSDGLPLLTSTLALPPDEEEWIDKDYIEIPTSMIEANNTIDYL